jgi:hypothetical protein
MVSRAGRSRCFSPGREAGPGIAAGWIQGFTRLRVNLFVFRIASKCHWKQKSSVCFGSPSLNRKPRPETRGSQGIEQEAKTWDKVIVDGRSDLKNWVEMLKVMVNARKVLKLFAFTKGHHALCRRRHHTPGMVQPRSQAVRNEHLEPTSKVFNPFI